MESIIFDYRYTVEGYVTFTITVKSGEFSGASNFCISESLLKDTISALSKMYNSLKGKYQMNDYDSDDFMCFEMENLGHMTITGQLGGSYNIPFLKYQIQADQTILGEIISNFKDMIL